MPSYFETGFSVREPMWHDLTGQFTRDRYPSSLEEAKEWAGHLWEPVEVGLVDPETFEPVAGYKQIKRSDNRLRLGVVCEDYGLVGNHEIWELVETALGQIGENQVRIETAGVLREGRDVWVLARLEEPFEIPSDLSPTYPYFSVVNSHDGSGSLRAIPTAVRIVCWNTWTAAVAEGQSRFGSQIVLRHTKNISERVEQVRGLIAGVRDEIREYHALMTELVGYKFDQQEVTVFVRRFLPEPPGETITDRAARNLEEAREAVFSILNSKTTESISNTGYGLVMAATEYLDYARRAHNSETRLRRAMIRPEGIKERAVTIVREMAEAS